MDLTEHGGAKINRLGDTGLKNNFITASNGSLVSTGWLELFLFTKHLYIKQNSYFQIIFVLSSD